MLRRYSTVLALFAALALALTAAFMTRPAGAASVTPTVVGGNPDCSDLGYSFGVKIDISGGPNGNYPFVGGNGVVLTTDGALNDPSNSVTISNSNGTTFNWSATLGIDAVIVKGGNQGANVYKYDPEATSDSGLKPPLNTNGSQAAISHIEFCYDYELTATKTANATYTRTYAWTIDKSVSPDAHSGFAGDQFSSDYAVVVNQTVNDTDFAVEGTITVNNPTPFTVGFTVSDLVNGTPATVSCPTYSLSPGGSTICSYSAGLNAKTNGTNTATITSQHANVAGATANADYTFGDPTSVVGYPTISVSDSVQGNLGSASADKTFMYSDDFACPSDPSVYTNGAYQKNFPNTATIVETGQSDNAGVSLTCYIPLVSKTASTSYDRSWEWTIEKTGDETYLTLSPGQSYLINYAVTVSATKTDTNHKVYGTITVVNPNPGAPMVVALSDTLPNGASAVISADADCDFAAGELTIPAGGTATCDYMSNGLTGPISGDNVATATLNGIAFTGKAAVNFGNPTSETDECINVTDDKYGDLGTVCANQAPKLFEYILSVTAPQDAVCGMEYTFVNTATFVTTDTGTSGSDDHTVTYIVPCQGCTLTQGYWKTHSDRGPAPYDEGWKQVGPLEEDTLFFKSGKTWYNVFWTPPAGNAFYNLAHQYMAAKLNVLNGASAPASVTTALADAEALFNSLPNGSTTLSSAQRRTAIRLASILDQYNNGIIGPGHCSE